MTQALAVQELLNSSGHEVVGVVAGRNSHRELPDFFVRGFPVAVHSLPSPGFVFRNGRSVDVAASVWQSVRQLGRFRRSLGELRRLIFAVQPDVILNFFEPLAGLLQWPRRFPIPVVAVGHQYMIHHPTYVRLPGHWMQQLGMRMFVNLVGSRAVKLALSLYEAGELPEQRLTVCPPLLRKQLFDLQPRNGDYYLIYLLNHGYAEEIERWHVDNAGTRMHIFYDKPGASAEESPRPNLTYHRLDGEKFLRMMAGCRAVVCTAGFESVSEAAWLGKPLFMVPVENHVEQMINALDAVNLGFGITDRRFRLSLLGQLPERVDNSAFRNWASRGEPILLRLLEALPARDPVTSRLAAAGCSHA